MKIKIANIILAVILMSCERSIDDNVKRQSPILVVGTWKLMTDTVVEKGDTVVTDYTKNVSFIKIINDTHFAFLQHDLNKRKELSAVFVSGGGSYSVSDSLYTEHLEYCSDRNWEGNDFKFIIQIKNDTLIQTGIEKIESIGVNKINVEKYVRVKK